MARRNSSPQPNNNDHNPVSGWQKLTIQKPKVTVKTGVAKKEAEEKMRAERPTLVKITVQLLPVWILMLVVVIVAPALPIEAARGVIRLVGGFFQDPETTTEVSEPVFIVEDASSADIQQGDVPPPQWDLEIADFYMPTVQYWAEDISSWSVEYRIKPNMIATIMQIESCGDPEAVSVSDALGLFQVLRPYFSDDEDPFDPDTNARRSMAIVEELLATVNGDAGLTFAAYNGGAPILYVSPTQWPEETQLYQFWASGIYEEAELGFNQSPTLEDWLNAGGASLCSQAEEQLNLNTE